MDRLSSGSERLLKDIMEHRNEGGSCDLDYWEQIFEELETDYDKEELLRSQFATLEDEKMISVHWASDVPVDLVVLDNGVSYYERYIHKPQDEMHDVNVFVSYNQKSGSGFADALEKKLDGKANVIT